MAIIDVSLLTDILTPMIADMRSNNPRYNDIINDINLLASYGDNLLSNNNLNISYNIYKLTQKISLAIRRELAVFIPDMETYGQINYAFYYNGKRYSVDHLNLNWLLLDKKGNLKINLDEIEKDFAEITNNKILNGINLKIEAHKTGFIKAIQGTYNGTLGKGKINMGHVAEAYEEHIMEHHTPAYQFLNSLQYFLLSGVDKVIGSMPKDFGLEENVYWSNHESIGTAWKHIRNSLGTQRGTAAADVSSKKISSYGVQVKAGQKRIIQTKKGQIEFGHILQLSSLNNLKQGVLEYSKIFNPNIPVQEVAKSLAIFLSEPITKRAENLIEHVEDEFIKQILGEQKASKIMVNI